MEEDAHAHACLFLKTEQRQRLWKVVWLTVPPVRVPYVKEETTVCTVELSDDPT